MKRKLSPGNELPTPTWVFYTQDEWVEMGVDIERLAMIESEPGVSGYSLPDYMQ